MGAQAHTAQEEDLRELWGPDPLVLLADEVDREVVRTLLGDAYEGPGTSVVDDLAAIAKWPHLPPILRRFANGSTDYNRDELHEAIHRYVRPWVRQPEVVQTDIEDVLQSALACAARGERTPDLHDRVLRLMIERGDYNPDLDPRIPEVELRLTVESIFAKPRKLGVYMPSPPEPSAVDRLAAQVDSVAAERVAKMDAAIENWDAPVRELRALFDDDELWGP